MTQKIEFVLQNAGETEEDRRESSERLKAMRGERSVIAAELSLLEAAASRPVVVPTAEEVSAMLLELQSILVNATAGVDPADAGTVRAVLEMLTGGRIDLVQAGERRKRKGWVEARFRPRLLETALSRLSTGPLGNCNQVPELVMVIREDTIASKYADQVHDLAEEGMLITGIAEILKIDRHQVVDAIEIWHERHGLPAPIDGRVRRSQMPQKSLKLPVFQSIADDVKLYYDQGLLVDEIAERVGRTRDTVRAALAFWFRSHGEAMPDGRNRRKTLSHKQRKSGNQDET